jgi:hypothetical protein
VSDTISGNGGLGATKLYELAAGQEGTLETLSFTVVTDATAGTHAVRVTLEIPTVGIVARLDDLNVSGPGQTNFYTYGLGLNASACTLPTGLAVTDALPWTSLPPGAQIKATPIDGAGATLTGDRISAVLLQMTSMAAAAVAQIPQPISLMPAAAAA